VHGTLEQAPAIDEPLEHPAPSGTLVAIEHQGRTPGGYAISSELAIRDGAGGPERVVYRAPELFYWSSWSPMAGTSRSGRSTSPRLYRPRWPSAGDHRGGDRNKGHAWADTLVRQHGLDTAAHPGLRGRVGTGGVDDKRLKSWSSENGSGADPGGIASYAPAWSGDGRSLYFASGRSGDYQPLAVFAGQGIGNRRIAVAECRDGRATFARTRAWLCRGGCASIPRWHTAPVLRRKTVVATEVRSIAEAPFEVWLTDADGAHGTALVRIPKSFGYSGWDPGPTEWNWSE